LTAVAIAALACLAPACQGGAFHGVVSQGNLSAADYDRMASGKVGTLRLSLRWTNVQPNADTPLEAWNWAGYDAVVAGAADRGVRILPVIDAPTPKGVGDPPTRRADRRAFAKFAGEVAARYGRGGAFWEGRQPLPFQAFQIYNEQNGPAYWDARPNVRDYGRLLRGAAKAIKGRDRGAEIVLGGMFSTPSGKGGINSWNYLAKLYRLKRIKGSFDTVAVHPYSESLRGIKYQVRRVLAVIRRNRDRKTDLRVTEFGWGSARRGHLNVGRKGQARMLTKAFRLFEGNKRSWNVKGVNWFSFQDNPAGECSFCPTSGLFEPSGDPKPSWRAFKRTARN
jgi:hypothetical protein